MKPIIYRNWKGEISFLNATTPMLYGIVANLDVWTRNNILVQIQSLSSIKEFEDFYEKLEDSVKTMESSKNNAFYFVLHNFMERNKKYREERIKRFLISQLEALEYLEVNNIY